MVTTGRTLGGLGCSAAIRGSMMSFVSWQGDSHYVEVVCGVGPRPGDEELVVEAGQRRTRDAGRATESDESE